MTKPQPLEFNALLEAVRQARPLPPAAEWMTLGEIITALKISDNQAHRRIQTLTKQGRLERLYAPRRGTTGGATLYYRLTKKNGKP